MPRKNAYQTKQRKCILDCLLENKERHVTVEDLMDYLRTAGETVGRTTVYRYLDRLAEEGLVRRFSSDGGSACFQYIDPDNACRSHFHLKCSVCDALFHLECNSLDQIAKHLLESHAFHVDNSRTVFYGTCGICANGMAGRENTR